MCMRIHSSVFTWYFNKNKKKIFIWYRCLGANQTWSEGMQILLRSVLGLGRWDDGDGLGIASRVDRGDRRGTVPVRSGDRYFCCCQLSLEKKKYVWRSWRKPTHKNKQHRGKRNTKTQVSHMFRFWYREKLIQTRLWWEWLPLWGCHVSSARNLI